MIYSDDYLDKVVELYERLPPEQVLYFLENSLEATLLVDALIGRSIWVDAFYSGRNEKGEFARLYPDLLKDDKRFFQYYRMHINTYKKILRLVYPHLLKHSHFRECISPEEKLMVTFRYLSTGLAFQSLSLSFRIAPCTISKLVNDCCTAIWKELFPIYMPYPTTQMMTKVADGFYQEWGFANCDGAIDGKHIGIIKPAGTHGEYYNYKNFHSSVLQGVADAYCRFIVIDVGGFGSQSDGGTLRTTKIYEELCNGTFPLPDDRELPNTNTKSPFFLIGDEAYPLRRFLMRPFPKTSLNDQRRRFNQRLSRARQVIECAFGLLVAKWRCLKNDLELPPSFVDLVVKVCCVLHNCVIDEEGLLIRPEDIPATGQTRVVGRQFNHSPREAQKVRDCLVDYYNSSEGEFRGTKKKNK